MQQNKIIKESDKDEVNNILKYLSVINVAS